MESYLVADIGGTYARFGIVDSNGLRDLQILECKNFAGLTEAAQHYLQNHLKENRPLHAIFAVAGPVDNDFIQTNSWDFKISVVQKDLGFEMFEVINDFEAVALAISSISSEFLYALNTVSPKNGGAKVVVGPGTGLGVASLIWDGNQYIPVSSEAAHMTFCPTTQREFDIIQAIRLHRPDVSNGAVCSGNGLVNLYNAIRVIDKRLDLPDTLTAEQISIKAIDGSCGVCKESLDLMLAFLGRIAGNIALMPKALGGVYIAGGIPTKLGDYFLKSKFMEEFLKKGRMSDLMAQMPVFLIKHDAIGLLGLENYAIQKLSTGN